ncbi:hypothetical protein P154DRAFT_425628, partial [Amniculicola lignicola CBS 123094]
IQFRATARFAITLYVGGVNTISGESAEETAETLSRRQQQLKSGKSVQDYLVMPEQKRLDGVVVKPGTVRQFVATPVGSGHSVEA